MSSVTTELLERNKEIKRNFLVDREIESRYRAPIGKFYGYIYCIENKKNGKKYIGSTYSTWVGVETPDPMAAMMKRASGYIYEYNTALKSSPSVRKVLRPIMQAMVDDGIENFIMYPLAETTQKTHTQQENEWIDRFDTIENGYNGNYAGSLNRTDLTPRQILL